MLHVNRISRLLLKAHDTRPKFLVQISYMRNWHEKLALFVMHSRTRFFSYEILGLIRTSSIFSRGTWHHVTLMNFCHWPAVVFALCFMTTAHLSTLRSIKTCMFHFYNSFGKYWPILIILSLSHSQMNLRKHLPLHIKSVATLPCKSGMMDCLAIRLF